MPPPICLAIHCTYNPKQYKLGLGLGGCEPRIEDSVQFKTKQKKWGIRKGRDQGGGGFETRIKDFVQKTINKNGFVGEEAEIREGVDLNQEFKILYKK